MISGAAGLTLVSFSLSHSSNKEKRELLSMFSICPTCKHRCELPKLLTKYTVGVEVGVLQARYSRVLLRDWPGRLHLVDPWEHYSEYQDVPHDHSYNLRVTRVTLGQFRGRFSIWRERDSENLANRIGMVDFAYIDGNHKFEYVDRDMRIWWNHIKPGGLLAGHDLFQVEYPDVTAAVVIFAAEHKRKVFIVPGKDGCACSEGGVPSWYIKKDG
jgi:hypothetical protein